MRYDYQEGIIPAQGEDRDPVTVGGITYRLDVPEDRKPIVWNTLSPRLGATFDLTGDGKTVLKASYSKYYLENIINYYTRTNPNGSFNTYWTLNPDWSLNEMYRVNITATASIDPDLKPSAMTEITFGIQRELIPRKKRVSNTTDLLIKYYEKEPPYKTLRSIATEIGVSVRSCIYTVKRLEKKGILVKCVRWQDTRTIQYILDRECFCPKCRKPRSKNSKTKEWKCTNARCLGV